jgi:hypothetical protein
VIHILCLDIDDPPVKVIISRFGGLTGKASNGNGADKISVGLEGLAILFSEYPNQGDSAGSSNHFPTEAKVMLYMSVVLDVINRANILSMKPIASVSLTRERVSRHT